MWEMLSACWSFGIGNALFATVLLQGLVSLGHELCPAHVHSGARYFEQES